MTTMQRFITANEASVQIAKGVYLYSRVQAVPPSMLDAKLSIEWAHFKKTYPVFAGIAQDYQEQIFNSALNLSNEN